MSAIEDLVPLTMDEFKLEQSLDPVGSMVINWVINSITPSENDLEGKSEILRNFVSMVKSLKMREAVLGCVEPH